MRSVHLFGWGLVVGATALGAILSAMTFNWENETFAAQAPGAATPATAPASATIPASTTGGQQVFDSKCVGCHTIGGGRLAGPDLKGVTDRRPHEWLVNFITAPDQLIAGGDPTAKQLVAEFGMPMPNLGISKADAEAILSYIAAQSGGGAGTTPGQSAAALPIGDAANGRLLLIGEKRLANGGPACLGCHNVAGVGALGGGNMGLDLTHSQTKFGAAGLASILQSPPYPGMAEAFSAHPITPHEIADLTAFLAYADTAQQTAAPPIAFPLFGIGAFALLLGVMQLGRRGQAQGVRRRLLERSGR